MYEKSFCNRFLIVAFVSIISAMEPTSAQRTAQEATKSLLLTFIANEGVMIESASHKVLIDALFDNPNPEYAKPSKDHLEKMETGQAPYDNIDLVLVTHNHPDHMSHSSVSRFLLHNPGALVVAPKDAVLELKARIPEWDKIKEQINSVDIQLNSYLVLTLKDIELKVFRTLHSGELNSPWNFMYLVFIDGFTVFHEGDSDGSMATFTKLGFKNVSVDLALVHFWFPLHPVGAQLLQEIMRPKHIGLFHLPLRLYNDAPQKIDMVKHYYPDIFILKESGQKQLIH